MNNKNTIFKVTGKVQHYEWGGYQFLPNLLGKSNSDCKPFAEYWLGAHDNFPSIILETGEPLNEVINGNLSLLGVKAANQFKRLPFLLKVLDVKDMLSIQVHPSKHAAELEFSKENEKGIALTAPNRNYKDDNHKPELMFALNDFWLLHGFKPEAALKSSLSAIPEFHFLIRVFEEGGYKALYKTVMEADQDHVNNILGPLLQRIMPLYEGNSLSRDDANFWAARAAKTYNKPGISDRGIFSIYMLNLVHLKYGEAIFQDAGVLHAYLEGQNMEIMANSDNVLRGGLTSKHIDVIELMKHVSFEAIVPAIIRGTRINDYEETYISPARDFELSRLTIDAYRGAGVKCLTMEVYIAMEGSAEIKEHNGGSVTLERGEAAVAFAGSQLELTTAAHAVVFRASLPVQEGE